MSQPFPFGVPVSRQGRPGRTAGLGELPCGCPFRQGIPAPRMGGMAASLPAAPAPVPQQSGDDPWTSTGRIVAVDNLKVALIAAVIAIHGVMGYAAFFDGWPYAEVQEVHLPDAAVIVVFALFAPIGLCMMALLFLVAGLLTAPSVDHKGPARFARDRLARLGIPFAVFVLGIWPVTLYALFRPLGRTRLGYWAFFTGALPNNGPLWFAGLLLLVSLGYAAGRRLRRGAPIRTSAPTTRGLLQVAAGVAAASFLVRLAYPYAGPTTLDLNEWQWPECIALFAVGVRAAASGWLREVPPEVGRSAGRIAAVTGVALAVFLLVALAVGVPQPDFLGGLNWAAFGVACFEGVLTVFGSLRLLAAAQRHLHRTTRFGRALARSAYTAFLIQTPVLIGLAAALRPVPTPAGIKALSVVVGGLAGSFGLGRLIVSRARVL